MGREQAGAAIAARLDRVAEPQVLRPAVGAVERVRGRLPARRAPAPGLRVARELDRRGVGQELTLAAAGRLDQRREQRREDAQQRGDDQQEETDQEARREGRHRALAAALPDEDASLPALDNELQEAVGHESDEPDEDGDVERVTRVEVADVPELVGHDTLELLAIHLLEKAAGHRDRGVLRVATRREGVLARVLDDVGGGHRDVGGDRQLPDDIDEYAVGFRVGGLGT